MLKAYIRISVIEPLTGISGAEISECPNICKGQSNRVFEAKMERKHPGVVEGVEVGDRII
jgi:hypothetical protein